MMAIGTAKHATDIPASFSSPTREVVEIALIGRSNVGKSTLLNALLGLEGTNYYYFEVLFMINLSIVTYMSPLSVVTHL